MSSQVHADPGGPEVGSDVGPGAGPAVRTKHDRPATDSMADGVGSRTSYAIALDVFEGPLDLLLHLVRRHELDILDIPIAFITEKYIEYISLARSLDIEVAGEYLLMAATLAFLKSRELLPVIPGEDDEEQDEEDGVDPREELIRRLIEYERFRDAGIELATRPIAGRDVFPRGGDLSIEPPEPGLAPVTLFRLAEAYNRVLDRAKVAEDHEVVLEVITVRQRVVQLSRLLEVGKRIDFEGLFLQQVWSSERQLRQMLVVTLMSVLEMVKLGILGVHQAQGSDAIELELTVDVLQMREVIADFRGDDEPEITDDDEAAEEVQPAGDVAEQVDLAQGQVVAAVVDAEVVDAEAVAAVEVAELSAEAEPVEAAELVADAEAVAEVEVAELVVDAEPIAEVEEAEPIAEVEEAEPVADAELVARAEPVAAAEPVASEPLGLAADARASLRAELAVEADADAEVALVAEPDPPLKADEPTATPSESESD